MRGYLSFLLVLAALLIFLSLSTAFLNSKSINLSKAISIERAEQLSLDLKRQTITAAKYGAIAGFLEYLAELYATAGLSSFNPKTAQERIKLGAYSSILLINSKDPDFQIQPWCGEISSRYELEQTAELSLQSETPLLCSTCHPISSPICKDYISVESGMQTSPYFANLALGSLNLGGTPKLFGFTIYSKKLNISKVAFIPTSEKLFQTPFYPD